ncbi:tetratricopeptide repeat protein [[Clostridium] aminophilum]|uniref:Sel1 repeat-containing protein n=1 Tax=[Clostridium] aminophilum TaxID=1526 RepID=A0A1I6KGP8_9FIRM|nr:tetratricopeptide repeat protein [[Clostridium] aminophilum]SFR90422.1 Sel1 repeat-containing protein [[Clostridium] aminophilum]
MKTVSNIQFFLHAETMVWLSRKYLKEKIAFDEGTDFSFENIEEPVHVVIKSEDDFTVVQVFYRSHLGIYDEASFQMKVHKDGTTFDLESKEGVDDETTENILLHYMRSGYGLYKNAIDHDFMSQFPDLDLENEGILITLQDEELLAKRVVGKNRPKMACTTIFGTEMCRPYFNEYSKNFFGKPYRTFEEILKAAEDGDEDAMEAAAMAYLNGEETDQDYEQSFYWWSKLAETGYATAQFNTGLYYAKALGVKRDFVKAIEWMEKAAENGDEDAPTHLKLYTYAEQLRQKAIGGDHEAWEKLEQIIKMLDEAEN